VRRNDEVAAQSRSERDRWTFYEIINPYLGKEILEVGCRLVSFARAQTQASRDI